MVSRTAENKAGSVAVNSLLSSQSLFAIIIESNSVEFDSKSAEFECVQSIESNKNRVGYVKQLDLLDRKFGHPSDAVLKIIVSSCNNISALNKKESSSFCSAHIHRKNHKLSFKKSSRTKTQATLELLHNDITYSIRRKVQILSKVDDHTRYTSLGHFHSLTNLKQQKSL